MSRYLIALTAVLCAAGAASAADGKATNLLEDQSLWRVVAANNRTQHMRWTKEGRLALSSSSAEKELRCSYGQMRALAGARLRVDMRFGGAPEAATAGGVRFEGIATPKGETLTVALMPEKGSIRIGDTVRDIKLHDNDPFLFDPEIAFGNNDIEVYWDGKVLDKAPVKYANDTAAIVLFVFRGELSIERLSLGVAQQAVSPAVRKREYSDVALKAEGASLKALASPWADYFGIHYAQSPEMAGIAWRTVRSYGGPHIGIEQDASARGAGEPARKGPFTGKEIRVGLRDFHRPIAKKKDQVLMAAEIVPTLIEHRITDINLISNIVPPSMAPFDKDLVYWSLRVMHEAFPKSRDVLCWEMGNEVVSAHFDPKGLNKNVDRADKPPRVAPDGKVFGYDIGWKRDFYVNQYLAPAVEATERVAKDVYGDPRAIKILVGSMNPYNDYNLKFLKGVMGSTFDGKQAPTLKGDPTWKHFDLLNVHYMTGSDATMNTMQEYLDQYVRTGKVKGIWITEEHGGGGKGPVTVLDRALRFLAWVAKNDLTADQARLVWYGIESPRAGGKGSDVTTRIGTFFKDRRVFLSETRDKDITYYLLADARDGKGANDARMERLMVVVAPAPSASVDLGTVALGLPDGAASREWMAEATQYSSLVPPETVAAKLTREGNRLKVAISRTIAEPFVVWLSTPEKAESAAVLSPGLQRTNPRETPS